MGILMIRFLWVGLIDAASRPREAMHGSRNVAAGSLGITHSTLRLACALHGRVQSARKPVEARIRPPPSFLRC